MAELDWVQYWFMFPVSIGIATTAMLSGIGGGTLVLSGVAWLLPKFDVFDNATIIQAIVGTSIIVVFGVLGWYLLNKPRVVDFMIATEAEMRKVNWPTRQEIIGSTWVVICGTVLMALLLFVIDVAFTYFFKSINILG